MAEQDFQKWYKNWSSKLGLNPNPDDPRHQYDYRAAYKSGAIPNESNHWPSEFKKEGHPNRFVNRMDTITGQSSPDTAKIKRNIAKMIDANAPESDIDAYVKSEGITPQQLRDTTQGTQETKPDSLGKKIYQGVVSPVVEAGGAIAGGIVGSGVTPIAGTVIGAGLGYAGARRLTKGGGVMLGYEEPETPTEALTEFAKDVPVGAAYEMGGQVIGKIAQPIGKGAKWLGRKAGETVGILEKPASVAKTGIMPEPSKRLAGKVYDQFTGESRGTVLTQPQIEHNIKVAKELQGRIPGLKFTQGQLTNDASAISLERALAKHGGQDLTQTQREVANKVLRNYYALKVSGAGQAGEFAKQVKVTQTHLETASKEATDAVQSEVNRLSQHMDEQVMGKTIHGTLSAGKQAGRAKAKALYDAIPDVQVKSENLVQTIDDIYKDFDPIVEKGTNIPGSLLKGLRSKLVVKETGGTILDATGKPMQGARETIKPISFSELRKLRSQVMAEVRTAQGSATPNDQYVRRLKMLQDGIEDTIDTLSQRTDKAGELYRQASSFYKEYAGKFKQGTVADVLAKGRRGEETRIAMANIASEFDSLDGIDAFRRAVGNNQTAATAMKDYYSIDLLNKSKDSLTGEVSAKRAMGWLARNTGKLKKLGIYDEFSNVAKMKIKADQSVKYLDTYNKSVAGKILNADINNMITEAFSGSKNYAQSAAKLMVLAKGNKAAEAGLKKAFADNIIKQSETTATDFFQMGGETVSDIEFTRSLAKLTNQIRKYAPAMKVIYRDEPEKIKALMDVWKAYNTIGRTAKSPIGGGSDTAELSFKIIDILGGAALPGKWQILQKARSIIDSHGKHGAELFLRRAMFDPDYAIVLQNIAKGKPYSVSNFERLITGALVTMGNDNKEAK